MVRFSSSFLRSVVTSWLNYLDSADQGLCVRRYRPLGHTHHPRHIRGPRLGGLKGSCGSCYGHVCNRFLSTLARVFLGPPPVFPCRVARTILIGYYLACLCNCIVWICHRIVYWGRWFRRRRADVYLVSDMSVRSECLYPLYKGAAS